MIYKSNRTKNYHIFLASARGEMHKQYNLPNQDAGSYFISKDIVFLGIADGLGSYKKSYIGSRRILEIGRDIAKSIVIETVAFTPQCVAKEFSDRWYKLYPQHLRQYSTTLKAVFIYKQQILALSVGDGKMSFYNGEEVLSIKEKDSTNFINETLCFSDAKDGKVKIESLQFACPKKFVLFMCTDGISLLLDKNKEKAFLNTLLEEENKLSKKDFDKIIQEVSKYNFDDKTLEVLFYDIKGFKWR